MQYLAVPGAIVALLTVGIILFRFFKAGVSAVIAINSLIKSIEANTAAHRHIARTVERFRKATQKDLSEVKSQIQTIDSRLADHDRILSPLE